MPKIIINITYLIFIILLMFSHGLCVVWPISGSSNPNADVMTSAFGPRYMESEPGAYSFHQGLDIRAQEPLPVHAVASGTVIWTFDPDDPGDLEAEGRWIRIFHENPDGEPQYYITQYLHLSEVYVTHDPPEEVPEGFVIGLSGNTSDPNEDPIDYHLHLDYRPSDENRTPWLTRINPLHNLSYDNQGEPQITEIYYYPYDPRDPIPDPGDLITAFGWWVSYPSTDLDLNEVYVALYYNGAWHSLNVNFDTRENVLEHNYYGGNIAVLHISPFDYPYPPGYKTIWFGVGPLTFEWYYPIAGIFGMVVNDIASPRCHDCEGEYSLPDCWWGNPNCESPSIGVTTFVAQLIDNHVLITWVLQTTIGLIGVNMWKSENLDGPFNKITETPFPVDRDNGRYELIDPNIENGHEYFYKLEFVLDDGTEIFVEDLIASTSVITGLPVLTSLGSVYPNPFNSQTLISFTIGNDQTDQIELTIYNTLGQKIRCLANGSMSAGSYTVLFDGKDDIGQRLASGVYLVNMQYGSYLETRKISILK